MLQLTPNRLHNAWQKAATLKPWTVTTRKDADCVTFKVTPRSYKRSGTRTFEERLNREFYLVRIELRRSGLFGECRDRTGKFCPALFFNNAPCYHLAAAVQRLEVNARRQAA